MTDYERLRQAALACANLRQDEEMSFKEICEHVAKHRSSDFIKSFKCVMYPRMVNYIQEVEK